MKIRNLRSSGFTLVEMMIVVAIIGLLAAIAIPNFVRARTTSQTNACINNLRMIDGAVQEWALEAKKAESATASVSDVTPYMRNTPVCPTGGTVFSDSYSLGATIQERPICKKVSATHVMP